MAEIKSADLVEYARMPQWGPGKVIHVGQGVLHVFFRDAEGIETKRLKPEQVTLRGDQHDAVLDNLPPFKREGERFVLGKERVTPQQALDFFLTRYPQGFADPGYIGDMQNGERTYKWAAHERFEEQLGGGKLRALVDAGDEPEITKRVGKVISSLNLLFPTEHAAFKEALDGGENVLAYYGALADLLDAAPLEKFGAYCNALEDLKSRGNTQPNKWTVATLLPFLAQPTKHVFVKPLVFQEGAARLAFDIHYEAKPNQKTYRLILRMCEVYWQILEPLRPVDLIDVQSFMWMVSSAFPKSEEARRAKNG